MDRKLRKAVIDYVIDKDISLVAFAKECGVSYQVIARYINKGIFPSFITQCKIAKFIGQEIV